MPFKYTYRLEFTNFEENNIRIDISPTGQQVSSGAVSPPFTVFFTSGGFNFIEIIVASPGTFFYVGMNLTVSGSASNDGVYTVISFDNLGSTNTAKVVQAVTPETSIASTLTDNSVIGDPQIIPLIGTGTPLVISTINNDQDKFQCIRSKQAVIQFISNSANGLDASTFSTGADNRFYVNIYILGGDTIFLGFLIMSDNQQPFQPDPQTVQLTATDHLGALKDTPLKDYQGLNPMGLYRIADLITMALKPTGLLLDLYVANNLRTGSGEQVILAAFALTDSLILMPAGITFFYPGQAFTISGTASNNGIFHVRSVGQGIVTIIQVYEDLVDEAAVSATFTDNASPLHMYDGVYLDAKTFEDQIGSCINCYDVLSYIFGQDCWVGQYKGQWWIRRIDEFDSFPVYVAHFTTAGVFVAIAAGTDYNKSIGAADLERFAKADTLLQFIRPHGFVKETYNFRYPLEIPCNKDYSRGDLIDPVSNAEKHFSIECWKSLFSNTTSDDPSTAGITFLRRDYINDYEVKRYVQISADPSGNFNFIMSEPVQVNYKDKFIINCSIRTSNNIGGSGFYRINAIQVRLYGDDGTFWTCQGLTSATNLPIWVPCDDIFRSDQTFFVMEGDLGSTNFTDSQSLFNGDSAEIPVSGYIKILIFANPEDVTARDTYIDSLTFDYLAYVNGSYQKYVADFNRVDRTLPGYMAKRDDEVFIYDSPNKLYKGAMQIPSNVKEFTWGGTVTVTFAAPNAFAVPGYRLDSFYEGMFIKIVGTASNNITTKVTAVIYHVIGDNTEVQVQDAIVTESVMAGFEEVVFTLTNQWFSAAPLALAITVSPSDLHPYGFIQAYSVWNQFRGTDDPDGNGTGVNIFTGSVLGLGTDWPDLIHKYLLTDINAQTANRYFVLISMSQDWRSCIWTAVLVECFNTVAGRNYTDPETFGYISQ